MLPVTFSKKPSRIHWLCLITLPLFLFVQNSAGAEPIIAGFGWSAISVGKDFKQLTKEIEQPENVLIISDKGGKTCYAQYKQGRIEMIFRCTESKISTIYFYQEARPWAIKPDPKVAPAPRVEELPLKKPFSLQQQSKLQLQNNVPQSSGNFHKNLRKANLPLPPLSNNAESPPLNLPDFTGIIDGGLTFDSTIAAVINHYGKPERTDSEGIHYSGMSFFRNNSGKIDRIAVHEKRSTRPDSDYRTRLIYMMTTKNIPSQGSLSGRKRQKQ